jgi:hypothetical protein
MIWARHLKLFTKVGMAALALGSLATSGNAQSVYRGKFTLAAETHWGDSTLPPGDYTLTLASNSAPYTLQIRGERVSVLVMAMTANDGVTSSRALLNVVDIVDEHAIKTFEAPGLGMTFIYWTPSQERMGRREARQKTTPSTAPASQISENKTSIEVHTTGR